MEQRSSAAPSLQSLVALGWERPDANRLFQYFPRNYYRFHFITSGTGYYQTMDETIQLSEGEGFFIFPGETPNLFPNAKSPWEYFWVAVRGSKIGALIQSSGFSRIAPAFRSTEDMDFMRRILADMCATSISPHSADSEFSLCLDAFFKSIEPYSLKKHKNSPYFEQCLNYINHNYASQIRVQDIANFVNIDRTYLYKMFKRNIGLSPQVYLLNYRIDRACELLRTTDKSVSEVAYSVGFQDYSNFSRQFKARCLKSPTAYRKNVRGKT
ncbi:MAG: AraC family transcriptional regulator [Oscillibacter sp.]|nr:AraC family transcriptional regulator [Oscillibacter sp.]